MGYRKKTVDDATDKRLNWFKDEKYSGLEKLTDLGWYFQILARRELVKRLDTRPEFDDKSQTRLLDRQIECVRLTPIVTLQSIKNCGLRVHEFHYLARFLTNEPPEEFLRVLNFGDLMDQVETFLAAAESIQSPALKRWYEWWMGPRWSHLIERAFSRREILRQRFASSTLGQLYPGSSIELIHLNLAAPDRVLRANFNSLLKRLRQAGPIEVDEDPYPDLDWEPTRQKSLSTKFWTIEPEVLLTKKVIQSMDLIIWEKQKGLKLTPLAKASLLFGERKLHRKERSKSMRRLSAQKKQPECENKRATNRMGSVDAYAYVVMNDGHPANDWLQRRAAMELKRSYETVATGGKPTINSDFVTSAGEREALVKRMFCP